MTHTIISRPSNLSIFQRVFKIAASSMRTFIQRRRDARLLSGFNEFQLRDIGMRRDQVSDRYWRF